MSNSRRNSNWHLIIFCPDLRFNPRARVGRDVARVISILTVTLFQSTRPCGARRARQPDGRAGWQFQSTRPCGARRKSKRLRTGQSRFNPRARVGRDSSLIRGTRLKTVSIHAPVWGATSWKMPIGVCLMVSIHAPVWGATHSATITSQDQAVSIHAPVWGATYSLPALSKRGRVSIHAPVWGATETAKIDGSRFSVSIHAPVWGATAEAWKNTADRISFNPRARVGRDFRR